MGIHDECINLFSLSFGWEHLQKHKPEFTCHTGYEGKGSTVDHWIIQSKDGLKGGGGSLF